MQHRRLREQIYRESWQASRASEAGEPAEQIRQVREVLRQPYNAEYAIQAIRDLVLNEDGLS